MLAHPVETTGVLETAWARARAMPWLAFMTSLVAVQVPWVTMLACCQLYQVSCLAMTTNERLNVARYTRFHTGVPGKWKSPYNQGWWGNLVSFWGLRLKVPNKGRCSGKLLSQYKV